MITLLNITMLGLDNNLAGETLGWICEENRWYDYCIWPLKCEVILGGCKVHMYLFV